MESQICQNCHQDCETAVNKQICMGFSASDLSVYLCFDRDDVSLGNFSRFFKHQFHQKRERAKKLIQFQNQHGGCILLQDMKKPKRDQQSDGLQAMQVSIELEKNVNQSLLDLHQRASIRTDPHLCDFLETHYLHKQVQAIKQLGDHITNLKYLEASKKGIGEYLFDKLSL
ncbi:ferritin heavy chain-like isoform X1 [Heptranchias perlo]|uniref:ferritin heavy chain-like isoform X1 n=1 Tax=Heptranchias perlo TaxID=212740 RepID=UPI003559490F